MCTFSPNMVELKTKVQSVLGGTTSRKTRDKASSSSEVGTSGGLKSFRLSGLPTLVTLQ